MKMMKKALWISAALIGLALIVTTPAAADQQILDDLIVDGSICAGLDCVNGESFGFDTLRLKENNLRIRAFDTSSSASFPTNDWQITFNETSNGGANKFSIDDIDGGRTPFTIEAGARTNALYVDDGGRIGIGTNTPVANLHVKTGNTPTLRLEQDGSSGFTAQIWDVAGNEANFFIRDASNSSTLPFRIEPRASSNAIYIEDTDDIGFGITNPVQDLHIHDSSGENVQLKMTHSATGTTNDDGMQVAIAGLDVFVTNREAGDLQFFTNNVQKLLLDDGNEHSMTGNLTVSGDIDSGGTTTVPDYVFEPDYALMPLDSLAKFIAEKKHLPNIPSAAEIGVRGSVNMTKMQMSLLEKVEELTLYTLAQHDEIAQLRAELAAMREAE